MNVNVHSVVVRVEYDTIGAYTPSFSSVLNSLVSNKSGFVAPSELLALACHLYMLSALRPVIATALDRPLGTQAPASGVPVLGPASYLYS